MPLVNDEASLARILKGKRVLLTGHTGFKGGWMALWLRRLGAEVTGIALPPPTEPSFCKAVGLESQIDSRIGDIRSETDFNRAVGGDEFDIIIHMAAQALVGASYVAPLDTYTTNVIGTAVVLNAARRLRSLKAVIIVTSYKCYDERLSVGAYRESDPMGGRDHYSASKGCAELVAASFRASHFTESGAPSVATVRAGNVFGGGDWSPDRLVPDIIRDLAADRKPAIRNPRAIRPWLHVLEPLRGYLILAASLAEGGRSLAGGWNFGPAADSVIPVAAFAELIAAQWQSRAPATSSKSLDNAADASDAVCIDSSRARVNLGWQPILTMSEAVALTVDWYRACRSDPDCMADISDAQISAYVRRWGPANEDNPTRSNHCADRGSRRNPELIGDS